LKSGVSDKLVADMFGSDSFIRCLPLSEHGFTRRQSGPSLVTIEAPGIYLHKYVYIMMCII
jgi:hypothetical protein